MKKTSFGPPVQVRVPFVFFGIGIPIWHPQNFAGLIFSLDFRITQKRPELAGRGWRRVIIGRFRAITFELTTSLLRHKPYCLGPKSGFGGDKGWRNGDSQS